jgi:hypothetical protein
MAGVLFNGLGAFVKLLTAEVNVVAILFAPVVIAEEIVLAAAVLVIEVVEVDDMVVVCAASAENPTPGFGSLCGMPGKTPM